MASDDITKLRQALDELQTINRVLDRIARVRESNHILAIIIEELVNATQADQGVINLLTEQSTGDPETVVRRGNRDVDSLPFKVDQILSGWVLRERRTLKIDDLDNDERFPGMISDDGRMKSVLICPMTSRDQTIGLLSLVRTEQSGKFTDEQARLVGIVASQSAHVLANTLLLEQMARANALLEQSASALQEENKRLLEDISESCSFESMIGQSPVMRELLTLASKVASHDSPVFISGPTGSGKELLARAIHFSSPRKSRPFVVKNCGVKTESLLESELFGHVRGAFTGADRDKAGLFREADGGTIFLDEIGDAPLSTQVAILRALENGEIRPVGADGTEKVDVRVISATNQDLAEMVEDGSFRRDLLYRLNTFSLNLPPLSARPGDIELLAKHFVDVFRVKLGKQRLVLSDDALSALQSYHWPGNVRQLKHELERAAVICSNESEIHATDLSQEVVGGAGGEIDIRGFRGQLRDILNRVEKEVLISALREHDGNIMRTSQELGLTRKGLRDKMSRHQIPSRHGTQSTDEEADESS
jgi:transcriptional regulator with GAF, ATPase, and Fis domain